MLALADAPFAEREAVLHPLHRAAHAGVRRDRRHRDQGIVLDCARGATTSVPVIHDPATASPTGAKPALIPVEL